MEWNGIEWNGMEWGGIEWKVMDWEGLTWRLNGIWRNMDQQKDWNHFGIIWGPKNLISRRLFFVFRSFLDYA